MNPIRSRSLSDGCPPSPGRQFQWLERIAAGFLLAVVAALAWILVVSSQPQWFRLDETVEVIIILVLLTAALVLVSVVALLHTRA
jgi:hypothetical protein